MQNSQSSFHDDLAARDYGPYFLLADRELRLFSVFDDLKYDRSDADIMAPPMRRHAIDMLHAMGFWQKTGSVLLHKTQNIRCLFPKPQILGASPLDITAYSNRESDDYYILTPTQTACMIISAFSAETACDKLVNLVQKQPININRIFDYLQRRSDHKIIAKSLGLVKAAQDKAITEEPLCRRRALR